MTARSCRVELAPTTVERAGESWHPDKVTRTQVQKGASGSMRVLALLVMGATLVLAQYSTQPAGPPPEELSPGIRAALESEGVRVVSQDGAVWAEFWFVKKVAEGAASSEADVTWQTVPHGALIGAVRVGGGFQDRRGQAIKPGVYTLRFSYWPIDGAHQGIEPNRDALLLSPAALDQDANATPAYGELVKMSAQAAGTSHPAHLSMWKADESDWKPGLVQMENDWILNVRVGGTPISIIVKGVNAHA